MQPEGFITELVSLLESNKTIDSELLDIVKNHILKENPVPDSVEKAARAIWKLAEDRAVEDKNA